MSENLRRNLLITLTHVEREEREYYSPPLIVGKVRSIVNCQAIMVAKEEHKEKGYHYHVGVLNDSASRNTVTKMVRGAFPEFTGHQCNVSFHKSFNTICRYVIKQDMNPYCWNIRVEECRDRAKRQNEGKRNLDSLKLLEKCSTWREVLEEPGLFKQVLRSYNSVKQAWSDVQSTRRVPSLESRLQAYIRARTRAQGRAIKSYTGSELGDRAKAVKWLGNNLCISRPHRKAQLLILGAPMTGKSLFIEQLQEFLLTYHVPMRSNDFSGATTMVDLWVVDEFRVNRMSEGILNSMLDGQKVVLDCKYGHVFLKDKNMPVVLIANEYPQFLSEVQDKAFATRINVTSFLSGRALETERVAQTLLEIIQSRNVNKLPSGLLITQGV